MNYVEVLCFEFVCMKVMNFSCWCILHLSIFLFFQILFSTFPVTENISHYFLLNLTQIKMLSPNKVQMVGRKKNLWFRFHIAKKLGSVGRK
jgi:hypothetical protein